MPKTIYTERDIDDLARRGVKEIAVTDDVYLTDIARERAEKLGIALRIGPAASSSSASSGPAASAAPARPVAATRPSAPSGPTSAGPGSAQDAEQIITRV